MRPFSLLTYIFRGLWDGIPVLIWLGLGLFLYAQIQERTGLLNYLALMFAIAIVAGVMRALRPVRKAIMLASYKWMLGFPWRPIRELGIWKLLLVVERYWPGSYSDYIGMVSFSQVYQPMGQNERLTLCKILWRTDQMAPPHLAKAARNFLREVDAPLNPYTPPRVPKKS